MHEERGGSNLSNRAARYEEAGDAAAIMSKWAVLIFEAAVTADLVRFR